MKVFDEELKEMVNVCDQECPKRECYWPRTDPGVFTQGKGYKTRGAKVSNEWICGTREVRGCPDHY